ncbi:MAG: sigma 54-interacting transcriptional regulator [Myxococcota bacterium]|nr:sigma 54-interacting transcriptional regulator [Myxococcota bacterium]
MSNMSQKDLHYSNLLNAPTVTRLSDETHGDAVVETVEVSMGAMTDLLHVEKCKLMVVDGPNAGREFILSKSVIRIGASDKNDLVLDDNTTSRYHCEIRRIKQEYLLVDRQSTNGTYIGKLKVRECFLYAKCEFKVGNSVIRFVPMVEEVPVYPLEETGYGELVGSSPKMQEIYGIIDKVAPSELSAVVQGETGTGKELVARAIHHFSRRASKPLVIFDCSAFPENLLESELFGHEKGAFSGAVRTHRGVFERAEGGTVFFDELGEMSVNLQPKFLRALENGEIRRVGGERTIKVDVRVVAATNRNLLQMVEEGAFRQDLYYRLAKVTLDLPPLRTRSSDIGLLIEHFLADLREKQPHLAHIERFSDDAVKAMCDYDWPGNVRELRNIIERATAFCEQETVGIENLPSDFHARVGHHHSASHRVTPADLGRGLKEAKERMVAQFERDYLIGLLERHNMNISRVAREAGVDRRHVYRLMKKYKIEAGPR